MKVARHVRSRIYALANYQCEACGQGYVPQGRIPQPLPDNVLTMDHIDPRADGGRTAWWNLMALCGACNAWKADMAMEAFLAFLDDRAAGAGARLRGRLRVTQRWIYARHRVRARAQADAHSR